jgi:hypothetical protein
LRRRRNACGEGNPSGQGSRAAGSSLPSSSSVAEADHGTRSGLTVAPPEVSNDEALAALADEMCADFARDGVIAFTLCYVGVASTPNGIRSKRCCSSTDPASARFANSLQWWAKFSYSCFAPELWSRLAIASHLSARALYSSTLITLSRQHYATSGWTSLSDSGHRTRVKVGRQNK